MIGKILGYTGLVAVIGLLLQTMATTYYLGKINSGLNTSLQSTSQLISIQNAVIEKNQSLHDVIATTKAMDQQLQTTLQTTQGIRSNILKINEINAATLEVNGRMAVSGSNSNQSLEGISTGMGQLRQSTEALYNSLVKLNELTGRDRANLHQMKAYTDQMNQKVPGVSP